MGILLIIACPLLAAAGVFLARYNDLTFFKNDITECAVLAAATMCFLSAPIVLVAGISFLW